MEFGYKVEDLQQEEPSTELNSSGSVSSRRVRMSWTTWIIDGALLAVVITGAWYGWPIQREAGRLHAKRLDLQRRVGELPIQDPTKYHVLLLQSDNPLEIRWRVFVPADVDASLLTQSSSPEGWTSSSSSFKGSYKPALEALIIVAISPTDESSNMQLKVGIRGSHSRGTNTMKVDDKAIQQMLKAKDKSGWQIAGKNGVEVFSATELVSLLALESLREVDTAKQNETLSISLGTDDAIAKARQR